MKKFTKVTILLVLLALMLISSCLVGFAKEKVITLALPEDIEGMDPGHNTTYTNAMLYYMIYDRLVDWDPETGIDIVPQLATEWKISPDGKEYTFKLRKGIKFHNGEPFNAECVKVSLERFLTDRTLKSGYLWVDLKEVEVVDDYTVLIKFKIPNVVALASLTQLQIIPAKAFKEKGKEMFDNPIGTGAFTWGYWKRGQEIVINKNPNYWGEPVYMDKFVVLPIGETSTRLAAVLTGEIDISGFMTSYQIPLAESSGDVKTVQMLSWDQIYLALNTRRPPFTDDIKFRQAIALAIDKEGITKHVMKGGRVSTGINPQGCFGFDDSLVPAKQDIEKAKQLLKESTYNGRTLDILVPLGWFPNETEVAQAINGNLVEIGLNTKLSILEPATFLERRRARDFDIFINEDAFLGDMNAELNVLIINDSYSMGNTNPELVELTKEQAGMVDLQERTELLRKIENIISTDFSPAIHICQFEEIYFQRKGIQGARYYGNRIHDFKYVNYEEW